MQAHSRAQRRPSTLPRRTTRISSTSQSPSTTTISAATTGSAAAATPARRARPPGPAASAGDHLRRVGRRVTTMSPGPAIGTGYLKALGTSANLLVTDPSSTDRACAILRAELDAIDRACSRFRPDSELWQLNHARGRAMRVSALLAEAVAVALAAAKVTDGDVDPTCGRSLVQLGYDRDFAAARHDTSPLSQPAVPAAGWQAVELDRERREIKIPAEVMLDLGATAKALAADRAAIRIAATLNCGVLVNLGGDIRIAGEPPDHGWLVGIVDNRGFDGVEGPAPPRRDASCRSLSPPRHDTVVTICDGGLATSSTKVRAWSRGSAQLHHIIEPSTG